MSVLSGRLPSESGQIWEQYHAWNLFPATLSNTVFIYESDGVSRICHLPKAKEYHPHNHFRLHTFYAAVWYDYAQ